MTMTPPAIEAIRAAMNDLLEQIIEHPVYMGDDATEDAIEAEGGDAACITTWGHMVRESSAALAEIIAERDRDRAEIERLREFYDAQRALHSALCSPDDDSDEIAAEARFELARRAVEGAARALTPDN
jgi:hypothetical protein